MGIVDEDVARVREATDFVAIASQFMQLKKVGRRYSGLCPFHGEKSPSFSVNAELGLYYCLAGETGVLTWDGVKPIRELAGGTHRILTERGRWVEAPFKSFGVQPLMRVTLTRNRQKKVLFATPEHRWFTLSGRHRKERTTLELAAGQTLAWSFPANRTRNMGDLSPFGVAHGITYGDGTHFKSMACVDLHGEKDAQLLKWFPLSRTLQCYRANGLGYLKVLDLPLGFKQRPSLDEAPTYLAGWLAGYIAADGHVAKDGTCSLNSASRSDLEFVRAVCTRLGIGSYGITSQTRVGLGSEPTELFRVHLITEDMDERFFLIEEHRHRFLAATKSWIRRAWVVRSVEPTDRVEEVFCAEVEGTHSFVLEDNILTGNCFGCQVKGDVITFVRELEHLDFPGAVEYLAAKAGITLRYDDADEGRGRKDKQKLTMAMTDAVDWYHQRLLSSPDAGAARRYLRERGLSGDEVKMYRLGWAPDDWDALAKALKLPEAVLKDTGLGFINARGRAQDFFRGRVLFPIFDPQGEPVAFGGRKLPGTEGPKYRNSSETKLYSKSKVLYGLNWAKEDVVRADEVIICEGYTDVIGFAAAGVPRAVATCGTSLTEEHVRLLKRFARRLVLAFDPDAAGQAAAERVYEWEQKLEIEVAVADLPVGQDPGDLSRADPDRLKAAVERSKPFLGFRVDRSLAAGDMSTPEGKARAAEVALEAIAEHPDELVRHEYMMIVSNFTKISYDRLTRTDLARDERAAAKLATDSRATSIRPSGSNERRMLRLLVDPVWAEEAAGLLHDILFTHDRYLRAYRLLRAADYDLHRVMDDADPSLVDGLMRLAAEDTIDEPRDIRRALLREAADRCRADLGSAALEAEDPTPFLAAQAWLTVRLEQIRDEARPGQEVEDQLLAWLADRSGAEPVGEVDRAPVGLDPQGPDAMDGSTVQAIRPSPEEPEERV